MKECQINWKSTDEEINNMTIEQAIEILESGIKRSKSNDYGLRKHMVKAYEIAVKNMKINLDKQKKNKYNSK